MNATEFEQRLRKLALRDGMTFATFAGLAEADRIVLRTTLLVHFVAADVYDERAVNVKLVAWLAGVGRMLQTDHVTLRRFLVDTAVLARTSDCAEYRVIRAAAAVCCAGVTAQAAEAVVADARRAAAVRRAARKAAWQEPAGGAASRGEA